MAEIHAAKADRRDVERTQDARWEAGHAGNRRSERQANIILRDAGLGCLRRRDVVKVGDLHPPFEPVLVGKAVHEPGQGPTEALRLPDPGQGRFHQGARYCAYPGWG